MSENESGEEVYEVEWIEKKRITETGAEYYIKWKGYSTFVYIRLTVRPIGPFQTVFGQLNLSVNHSAS